MSGCSERGAGAAGRTPKGGVYRQRKPRASPLYQCANRHLAELRSEGRLQRLLEERVIECFPKCGDPHHGFARVYCPECRHDYLLAFSCKARYFCPSCHQKRVLAEVLKLLVAEGAIGERLSASLLAWRHSGFSVHNGVRVPAGDIEGRKKLAQYMLRAPLSLEKMTYLPDAGMVVPDRFEHLVRYVGWYSTRVRGVRPRGRD